MSTDKLERRKTIKFRIRKKISGTAEKPRMTVFRSNKQIYAQIIDDVAGKTLAYVSSTAKDFDAGKVNKKEQAKLVGQKIAAESLKIGVSEVVFDRNGYLYHGRVKMLADGAREGGLKF